jgi:hypothetical protein
LSVFSDTFTFLTPAAIEMSFARANLSSRSTVRRFVATRQCCEWPACPIQISALESRCAARPAGRQCRCLEASAQIPPSASGAGGGDSRRRHRRGEGKRGAEGQSRET